MNDGRRRRIQGGKIWAYWPDFPLRTIVSPSGWVVEARAVLALKLGVDAKPRCANPRCNRRIDWARGSRPTASSGNRALQVWYLDDNPKNVHPDNLVPSCASCVCASYAPSRARDGQTGRFVA